MTSFALLDDAPVASAPLQSAPLSVTLTNGNTLSYWNDFANVNTGVDGGSTGSLRGQLHDSQGNPIGDSFWLNARAVGGAKDAVVVAIPGGGFAAGWTSEGASDPADTSGSHVSLRIFSASGAPQGLEFVANGITTGFQNLFDVLALDNGNLAVLYRNYSGAQGLRASIFDASGNAVGSETLLGGPATGRFYTDAEALAGGGFILTWSELSGGNYDVRAQVFDAAGAATGSAFTVNQTTSGHESTASITVLADGRMLVQWKSEAVFNNIVAANQTMGRFLNAEGTPSGSEFLLSEEADKGAIVTALADGGFAIAWDEYRADNPNGVTGFNLDFGNFQWITAQRFDAVGLANGPAFQWEVPGHVAYSEISHAVFIGDFDETPDGRLRLSWTENRFTTPPNGNSPLTSSATFVRYIDITTENSAPVINWMGGAASVAVQMDEDVADPDVPPVFEHDFGRVTTSDVNGNRLTFSLSGEDAALFTLDPVSGRLILNQRLDFDDPTDAGRDNTYRVTITVNDGASTDAQDFVLSVTNIVEGVLRQGTAEGDKLSGTAESDLIYGAGGNDALKGFDGNDWLEGGSGNDKIDGGTGADTMLGGLGNDTYTVDHVFDTVSEVGGSGTDTVNAAISYVLGDDIEKLVLTGTANNDGTGNALGNTITGNAGANRLYGLGGKDVLSGGGGDDFLYGGSTGDTLTGGAGADQFVFDTLETSAAKDTIKDFAHGVDKLVLEDAVFAALLAGPLAANALAFGLAATTADHRLIYNQAKGTLFYDADGVGGAAQIQIAVLTNLPTLDAADFLIV